MFFNHTADSIFDTFEHKYENRIYAQFSHIRNVEIHCYSSNDYQNLENVPPFESLENDPFAFACNRIGDIVVAYIIYSPEICKDLNLDDCEQFAAIAHEVGHIIHYFNSSIGIDDTMLQEINADEVVKFLDLSSSMIELLRKLLSSDCFTNYQKQTMQKRIMLL